MDAYTFTFFRLLSGAIMLLILFLYKNRTIKISLKQNWISAFMLFAYAISFSFAFINLDAGIGTLILFAVVQLTMILIAILKKESVTRKKLFGIALAFAGLTYLLIPNETLNLSFFHVSLMIISGIAWAFYTILGKNANDSVALTTENFTKSIVFLILFYVIFNTNTYITYEGIILACFSGAITSALGYVLWYYVLAKIEIITAGIIQLIVPVISIFLSIVILGEELSLKLIISSMIILCGIVICLVNKKSKS